MPVHCPSRAWYLLAAVVAGGCALMPTALHAEETPAKTKLAVMDLSGVKGVDAETTRVVGQYLATKIGATGRFTVITSDDVKSMLAHEQVKMQAGCDAEASCLAEIGGALGVQLLVNGTLAVMGDEVLVTLALIDVRQATVVRRETERVSLGLISVESACLKAVDAMLPRLLPDQTAAPGRLWTWVAAGGAAVVLAAGAGMMWFGNDRLTVAEQLAASDQPIDYAEFDAAYTPGQIGWYGGLAALGVGAAALAGAVALFFVEGEAGGQ